MSQGDLFDNGVYLRDRGIEASKENADMKIDKWSSRAFELLNIFIQRMPNDDLFMAEDVRLFASKEGLEEPPSKRAWGYVIVKAARSGLIVSAGYREVKNPFAHRTPATLWKRI